ncbi:hypothetical protein quinque_015943 [Culex quinquefasciatus]
MVKQQLPVIFDRFERPSNRRCGGAYQLLYAKVDAGSGFQVVPRFVKQATVTATAGVKNTPPGRERRLGRRSQTINPASSSKITGKRVEPKLVQIIMDEIVEGGAKVEWQDIAGQ